MEENIAVNDFVTFKNPMPDEIWNGEPLRYIVREVDSPRAMIEPVTLALSIRPAYRVNLSDLEKLQPE